MSDKIIRIEKQIRKSGGPRTIHIYKCKVDSCNKEIKVRSGSKSSRLCSTHSHTKRPFESVYNSIMRDIRGYVNELTYEEFIEFTKNKECHYCDSLIIRTEYSTISGSYISRAYFLDRKDLQKGYTKTNLVTCCTRCNLARGNRYTYEEWLGMTEYFRRIK